MKTFSRVVPDKKRAQCIEKHQTNVRANFKLADLDFLLAIADSKKRGSLGCEIT